MVGSKYLIHYTSEFDDIVIRACKELDIPIVLGRRIVWYMFNVLKQNIVDKTFKSVRFFNLGTFGMSPKGVKRYSKLWKKQVN